MQSRKPVNVKTPQRCEKNEKAIDLLSLGHLGFGLTTASVFIFLVYFSQEPFNTLLFYTSIFASAAIFIVWEIMERCFLSRKVYKREQQESTINSITDIIIDEMAFLLYFLIVIQTVTSNGIIIFLVILPFAIDALVFLVVRKCI